MNSFILVSQFFQYKKIHMTRVNDFTSRKGGESVINSVNEIKL